MISAELEDFLATLDEISTDSSSVDHYQMQKLKSENNKLNSKHSKMLKYIKEAAEFLNLFKIEQKKASDMQQKLAAALLDFNDLQRQYDELERTNVNEVFQLTQLLEEQRQQQAQQHSDYLELSQDYFEVLSEATCFLNYEVKKAQGKVMSKTESFLFRVLGEAYKKPKVIRSKRAGKRDDDAISTTSRRSSKRLTSKDERCKSKRMKTDIWDMKSISQASSPAAKSPFHTSDFSSGMFDAESNFSYNTFSIGNETSFSSIQSPRIPPNRALCRCQLVENDLVSVGTNTEPPEAPALSLPSLLDDLQLDGKFFADGEEIYDFKRFENFICETFSAPAKEANGSNKDTTVGNVSSTSTDGNNFHSIPPRNSHQNSNFSDFPAEVFLPTFTTSSTNTEEEFVRLVKATVEQGTSPEPLVTCNKATATVHSTTTRGTSTATVSTKSCGVQFPEISFEKIFSETIFDLPLLISPIRDLAMPVDEASLLVLGERFSSDVREESTDDEMEAMVPSCKKLESTVMVSQETEAAIPMVQVDEATIPSSEATIPTVQQLEVAIPSDHKLKATIPSNDETKATIPTVQVMETTASTLGKHQTTIPTVLKPEADISMLQEVKAAILTVQESEVTLASRERMETIIPMVQVMEATTSVFAEVEVAIPNSQKTESAIPMVQELKKTIPMVQEVEEVIPMVLEGVMATPSVQNTKASIPKVQELAAPIPSNQNHSATIPSNEQLEPTIDTITNDFEEFQVMLKELNELYSSPPHLFEPIEDLQDVVWSSLFPAEDEQQTELDGPTVSLDVLDGYDVEHDPIEIPNDAEVAEILRVPARTFAEDETPRSPPPFAMSRGRSPTAIPTVTSVVPRTGNGDAILDFKQSTRMSLVQWKQRHTITNKDVDKRLCRTRRAIKSYLESEWTDANLGKCLARIDARDEFVVAEAIFETVEDNSWQRDVSVEFTPPAPPLPPYQQKLLLLIQKLSEVNHQLPRKLVADLEEKLFRLENSAMAADDLRNLSYYYSALMDLFLDGDPSTVFYFIVKSIYFFGCKSVPMVFVLVKAFPLALPKKSLLLKKCSTTIDWENMTGLELSRVRLDLEWMDSLDLTVMYLLTCIQQFRQGKNNAFKDHELFSFLPKFYGFALSFITAPKLLDILVKRLVDGQLENLSLSLILLAKRANSEFTLRTMMKLKLLPLLQKLVDETMCRTGADIPQVKIDQICLLVEATSTILKAFADEKEKSFKELFPTIVSILSRSTNHQIQDSCVKAILRLQRLVDNHKEIFTIVRQHCEQSTGATSSGLRHAVQTFIHRKNENFFRA